MGRGGNCEEKKVSTGAQIVLCTWVWVRGTFNGTQFFFSSFFEEKNFCNILRKRKTILRKENRYHVRLLVLVNAFCMKNTHTLHSPNIVSAMQTERTDTHKHESAETKRPHACRKLSEKIVIFLFRVTVAACLDSRLQPACRGTSRLNSRRCDAQTVALATRVPAFVQHVPFGDKDNRQRWWWRRQQPWW